METSTPIPTPAVAPVSVNRVANTDTISTLTNSIGVNGALLVCGLLLFKLLWSLDAFRVIFRSRLHIADDDVRKAPPSFNRIWLRRVLWLEGDDLIDTLGLDAYFYLRFQRLAVCISLQCWIFKSGVVDAAVFGVASSLFCHWFSLEADLSVQIIYFGVLTVVLCPVLIPYNTIPDKGASTETRALNTFHFSELSLDNIRNGAPALWLHIAFAYAQAIILVYMLARECRHYAAISARHHLGATFTLQVDFLTDDLRDTPSFAHFVRKLASDDDVVRAHIVKDKDGNDTQVGFVTMASVGATGRLISAINIRRPKLIAKRAPLPDDLIWENVVQPRGLILTRRMASAVFLFVLIAIWTVPLTAIASLNVLLPEWLIRDQPFMQGVLPAWLFLLLLTLTPRILVRLSKHEMSATHSGQHASVFSKFTWVLFFDFFLFGIVSRGLIQTLLQTANRPRYLQEAVASAIPQQSTSVIIYLLSFTCLTLPFVDLDQIVAVIFLVLKRFRAPSALPLFPYGEYYSYQVLHVLMGYTYATIAPLMLPFVLIYFVIAAAVAKVQFCYVYGRREGCAMLFPLVISRTVRCAMAGVAVLLSVMISKEATTQALTLIPILAVLVVADYHFGKLCRRTQNVDLESESDDTFLSPYLPPWQAPAYMT